MHFITGGAFNGKRNWVKNFYDLNKNNNYTWLSAYESQELISDFTNVTNKYLIIEGIELYIKETVIKYGESTPTRNYWNTVINDFNNLTVNYNKTVILIGADITKGIVPMEKLDRTWRDTTGWIYQDIVSKAARVDLILYGIATQLK